MTRKILWAFGPLALIALLGITSGGFPFNPKLGTVTATSFVGGAVSGTTGAFSGAVSGTTGAFSSTVSGTAGTFTGAVSGTTGTFTQAIAGTARDMVLQNSNAGTGSATNFGVQNDLLSIAHELDLGYVSSTFAGAFLTGGSTGESAYLNTPSAISLCVGSNNICKINAVGSAGVVLMPGGGFGAQVGAPTGGDKGTGTFNATAVYQGGIQVPKIAWASMTGSGACAIVTSASVSTCVRTGTGLYTITLSALFASTPTCTATMAAGVPQGILLQATTTTNVSLIVENASLTAIDFNTLGIMCVGI